MASAPTTIGATIHHVQATETGPTAVGRPSAWEPSSRSSSTVRSAQAVVATESEPT